MSSPDYCRDVETYLCRKNDGHLVRIVGPSFDVVSKWEADGVPMKVVLQGIDRYFERYYRQRARRRPVRIDFCDADVRDVFDEWRRAVLQVAHPDVDPSVGPSFSSGTEESSVGPSFSSGETDGTASHSQSLPKHLERVVMRLTSARATGQLGPDADAVIDRVSNELDTARASARGLRGAAREALLARLEVLDTDLVRTVRSMLDDQARRAMEVEADEELAGFRSSMNAEAYGRARELAIDRLARDRFKLPTVTY